MWALWPFVRSVADSPARATEGGIAPCRDCLRCVSICPSSALKYRDHIWQVDLARCIFCHSCAQVCPNHLIGSH